MALEKVPEVKEIELPTCTISINEVTHLSEAIASGEDVLVSLIPGNFFVSSSSFFTFVYLFVLREDENQWLALIFKPGATIFLMVAMLLMTIVNVVYGSYKLVLFIPDYKAFKFPITIILFELFITLGILFPFRFPRISSLISQLVKFYWESILGGTMVGCLKHYFLGRLQ